MMFAKLRTASYTHSILGNNPILQYFDIGKVIGTAGPEHLWRIHEARRRSDGKEASIFVFEKRQAEKIHKPKRKDAVTEILRNGVRQLERCRHPKLLQVLHSVEECGETLAFATEALYCSLANICAAKAESKKASEQLPNDNFIAPVALTNETAAQCAQPVYDFLDIEYKYGIIQITEGLSFLHYTCHLIHKNICPESILITKKGTWKLSGLEFTAPEIQMTSKCSVLSDMFSLGMLIIAVFNYGKSLIDANHSASAYMKQVESLTDQIKGSLNKVPAGLQSLVCKLLQRDFRQRPTSQIVALVEYFSDPAVGALQFLDIIGMKDPGQKSHFYRNTLMDVLPVIPKKLWFQHVYPSLQHELKVQEVLAAVLNPIFYIIEESSTIDFETHMLPSLKSLLNLPKSVQASVTLLENIHVLLQKSKNAGFKAEILSFLNVSLESSSTQIQNAGLIAVCNISNHVEEASMKNIVLPKIKIIYEANSSDMCIILNFLSAIEKIIDKLERNVIIDEVLPLMYNIKLQDADVISKVVSIYRIMLSDKKYGLSVNIMATKVMPLLIPQTVNPSLNLEQFTNLLIVLSDMMDHIDRQQRNKLKLDNIPTPLADYRIYRYQHSSDNMMSKFKNLNIPTLPARKTSSAEEMLSYPSHYSASYCNRRLSDNALAPEIRVVNSAASSPGDSLYGSSDLPIRRHSSFGTFCRGSRRGTVTGSSTPGQFFPYGGRSAPGSITSLLSPNSRRHIPKNRRTSGNFPISQGSFFQQLGSGMVGAVNLSYYPGGRGSRPYVFYPLSQRDPSW